MDYFGWVDIPLLIIQLFSSAPDTATPGEIAEISVRQNLVCLGIGAGLFVLFLILGGIGLNALAQKEGFKKSAFAYLPFFNTYFAGKVAGQANFFGAKLKRAGLYAAISEFFYCVLQGACIVFNILLTRGEYIIMESIEGTEFMQWTIDPSLIPSDKKWMYTASQYCSYISFAFQIIALIFMVILFFALFKKYYARSPYLMTFLCVLPFRGAVLFSVRNNARLDYDDYYRRRQEEYMRRNGAPYTPPYGAPPEQVGRREGDDPFGEYTEKKPDADDPFSEFGQGGNSGSDDDPFKDV